MSGELPARREPTAINASLSRRLSCLMRYSRLQAAERFAAFSEYTSFTGRRERV